MNWATNNTVIWFLFTSLSADFVSVPTHIKLKIHRKGRNSHIVKSEGKAKAKKGGMEGAMGWINYG